MMRATVPQWFAQRLLICADDFAYNASCSQAIAMLALKRKIHATSAMVLSPRWASDAALLTGVRGEISVGLHLDWTSEYALQAGHGLGLGAAMVRSWLPTFATGFGIPQARRLIDQQLDAFEAHWGAPPDHIDGHQHVQQFAVIRDALVQAVVARYPLQRPWLRISAPLSMQKSLKNFAIHAQGARHLIAIAQQNAVPVRPVLCGVYGFEGGAQAYRQRLAQWLREAPQGTVLMCHPALEAQAGDAIGAARVWEYEVLSGATRGMP